MPPDPVNLHNFACENNEGYRLLPAEDDAVKEMVFRLRYTGYRKRGFDVQAADGYMCDRFDSYSNAYSFLLLRGTEPVGTLRLNHRIEPWQRVPAMVLYAGDLDAAFDQPTPFIEINRLIVNETCNARGMKALFQLFRAVVLHARLTRVSRFVGTFRSEHIPFYRSLFNFEILSEPRLHPEVGACFSLCAGDMKRDGEAVLRAYPKLRVGEGSVREYRKLLKWPDGNEFSRPVQSGSVA